MVNSLTAQAGDVRVMGSVLGWEDPLGKGMATTALFLPGESHGQTWATDHRVTESQTRLT